jgi:DnaJ-class molecular chaperone
MNGEELTRPTGVGTAIPAEGAGMPKMAGEEGAKSVEVPCSFCGGKGKDPFEIMSALSTCCVCGGRGVVRVKTPYTHCAHCRGTGAIKTLTCTVCGGKGFLPAAVSPSVICPECRGTGDDTSAPAMACLTCRGRGWVLARKEESPMRNEGPEDGKGSRAPSAVRSDHHTVNQGEEQRPPADGRH